MHATAAMPTEASANWSALGTGVRLVVTSPDALGAARLLLQQDLAAVDLACSRFRSDSEITALDQAAQRFAGRSGQVVVSPLLAEAIAVSLQAAQLSGGDLDPTVGAAMNAIGYDRDFSVILRDERAAAQPVNLTIRQVFSWRDLDFDERSRTVSLPRGVRLDLGATAKAWAADRAAAKISSQLGCGVLVGLGGDIAVAGRPPDGGWRVRVQDISGNPADPPAGPATVVAIQSGGLATSSTAARRWRRGGRILHHILDPRTGMPAPRIWRTVSVAAPTCTKANTASTVAVIRGLAAPAWLATLGLPARLVTETGAVHTIGGWPAEGDELR
jgi:FAD:protein FMN transferase